MMAFLAWFAYTVSMPLTTKSISNAWCFKDLDLDVICADQVNKLCEKANNRLLLDSFLRSRNE